MYFIHTALLFTFISLAFSQKYQSFTVDDSHEYSIDRLDGIQYSSDWQTASSTSGNTTHSTRTQKSNLVYFFQGNAIYYYADSSKRSGRGRISLDGGEAEDIHYNASTGVQEPMWYKEGLGPGDHQITIWNANINSQPVSLDYFRIESDHGFLPDASGPAASTVPQEAVTVDSTSSNLVYSSGWSPVFSTANYAYYGGSTQSTSIAGSTATLKFKGTAVWYFGSQRSRFNGAVNVTLDDAEPVTINLRANSTLLQRILWSKTGLIDGEHTVVLEHTGPNGSPADVDFFRNLHSPNSTPSSSATQGQQPSHIREILGGLVGGLAALGLGAVAIVLFRRRRARRTTELISIASSMDEVPAEITPFEIAPQSPWGYVNAPLQNLEPAARANAVSVQPNKRTASIRALAQPQLLEQHRRAGDETDLVSVQAARSDSGLSDGMQDGLPAYIR
ncbi:transmembrane protein [Ceratobasidium sp. AG-Ba]|nr:transmembrane protein [Ceratobasidium sp. AG-Ba]